MADVNRRFSLDPKRRESPAAVAFPLAGNWSLVASARVIRESIGAWAATQPPAKRPDAAAWRDAIAVTFAAIEVGQAVLRGPADSGAPWAVPIPVPAIPDDLATRALLPSERVRAMVDLLISAQVFVLEERVSDDWVIRISRTSLETSPILASIAWETVRQSLPPSSTPAALAVIRELARHTTPADWAAERYIRLTYHDLMQLTGYGKTALQTAIRACTTGSLVHTRTRDRLASFHRLLPRVLRHDTIAASASAEPTSDRNVDSGMNPRPMWRTSKPRTAERDELLDRQRPSIHSEHTDEPTVGAPPAVNASSQVRAEASPLRSELTAVRDEASTSADPTVTTEWATIEINGVPLPVPAGVTPIPEHDSRTGDWYLRVGPNIRYGPIKFG